MPELPDVVVYAETLEKMLAGKILEKIRIKSPFVVRSFDPPISAAEGKSVLAVRRLGKRIVFELEGNLFLVVHLMIAGRFHWKPRGATIGGRIHLAALDFASGTLLLTEASQKKRASIHLVSGSESLAAFSRGGIEPLGASPEEFEAALRSENHTLKRALTDPRLFSGIGNAYSDEILHAARLSPLKLTSKLSAEEVEPSLRGDASERSSNGPTGCAANPGEDCRKKSRRFGKGWRCTAGIGKPCPVCGAPVQRIVYAENEANYCPRCQTGGKLLADRALSRLMHSDWPKTLEELEERKESSGKGR